MEQRIVRRERKFKRDSAKDKQNEEMVYFRYAFFPFQYH